VRIAVAAAPWPGHALPAAALAAALRDRGHDVLVLTGDRWLAALRRDGLAALPLPTGPPDPRDDDFGFRLHGRGALQAPEIATVLARWGAGGVVADTLTAGAGYAAGLRGLPWAELVPHPLQDLSSGLPIPGSALAPARGRPGRARDAVLRRLAAGGIAAGVEQRRAARRSLGLPADGPPCVRLIATLPGLELPRPDWPGDAVVVGPLEWDPAATELAPPTGDGPLVFLSSSTVAGTADLLDVTLPALAGSGMRLACTRFDAYRPPAGRPLPGWAAAGPGRQAPLLDSAAVVVGGAGHGILAKALVRGRPLVCVPGGGEQRDNAARVRRAGAGLVIRPRRLSPVSLRAAVGSVLADQSYAAAAARIAATAAGLGPPYAAEVAERALGRN
jgi:UDP:flavonoid glycosyltransferase YjiC (YdhE family)